MAKGLDQIKLDIVRAYQSRDPAALKAGLASYQKAKAAAERSQANIVADVAKMGPDVSGDQFAPGVGYGMTKVAGQLAQLALPKGLEKRVSSALIPVTDEDRDEAERLATALRSTRSGRVGQFVGETAAALPLAGAAGGVVRAAGSRSLPILSRLAGYGAEGAAGQAATTGEVTPGGVVAGVAGGLGGDVLGKLMRVGVGGLTKKGGSDVLLAQGADLTPGQLNPQGLLNRLERAAEASPVLGPGIARARVAATKDVVPNLMSDIVEMPRQPGQGLQGAARQAKRKLDALYGPAKQVTKPRMEDLADFRAAVMDSLRRNAPPDLPAVNAQLKSSWARVARARDTRELKLVISDLRAKARQLDSFKPGGNVSRAEEARVYKDAANWMNTYYKRNFMPRRQRAIGRADEITAAYKPVETAARGAAAQGRDTPTGAELLRQLAKGETAGTFLRNQSPSQTRRVAEALAEHEVGQPGIGGVERQGFLRKLLSAGIAIPATAARSKTVRRFARGETLPQTVIQKMGQYDIPIPGVPGEELGPMGLLRALAQFRRGVPGATMDELDEVEY